MRHALTHEEAAVARVSRAVADQRAVPARPSQPGAQVGDERDV